MSAHLLPAWCCFCRCQSSSAHFLVWSGLGVQLPLWWTGTWAQNLEHCGKSKRGFKGEDERTKRQMREELRGMDERKQVKR